MKKNDSKKFVLSKEGVAEALRYIQAYLSEGKLSQRNVMLGMLLAEETMLKFVEHGTDDGALFVSCSRVFGNVKIHLRAKGSEFDIARNFDNKDLIEFDESADGAVQSYIQGLIFKRFENRLSYKHRGCENSARILVKKSEHALAFLTIAAMIVAVIVALLMNEFVSAEFNKGLTECILLPARDMYMHGLSTLVGPLVFLSIAASVASFGNLSALGRISAKVLGTYFMTSLFSLFVGFSVYQLFIAGSDFSSVTNLMNPSAKAATAASFSFKETIVNIVPTNIMQAFLQNNYLQIIFLGVLFGIAGGKVGEHSKLVRDIFEAFNDLFLVVVGFFVKLVPLIIFVSLMIFVFTTGTETIVPLLKALAAIYLGMMGMVGVYCLCILVFARTNPIPLVKKYFSSTALTVFALSSSNAAIPLNMKFCGERLGVSKKVYSFSIPLGATINMDGTSLCTTTILLLLASLCGIDMTPGMYLSFFAMSLLLAFGSPGVPGVMLVILVALMEQLGVPMEFLGIAIVMSVFLNMPAAVLNTTGDVAATFITAKSEGLVDMDVYRN